MEWFCTKRRRTMTTSTPSKPTRYLMYVQTSCATGSWPNFKFSNFFSGATIVRLLGSEFGVGVILSLGNKGRKHERRSEWRSGRRNSFRDSVVLGDARFQYNIVWWVMSDDANHAIQSRKHFISKMNGFQVHRHSNIWRQPIRWWGKACSTSMWHGNKFRPSVSQFITLSRYCHIILDCSSWTIQYSPCWTVLVAMWPVYVHQFTSVHCRQLMLSHDWFYFRINKTHFFPMSCWPASITPFKWRQFRKGERRRLTHRGRWKKFTKAIWVSRIGRHSIAGTS